jgi:hypothetical protein
MCGTAIYRGWIVSPTSGGVNPALTIATNALRVASHLEQVILKWWKEYLLCLFSWER